MGHMKPLSPSDVEYTTALIHENQRLETEVRLATKERLRLRARLFHYRLTVLATAAFVFAYAAVEFLRLT